jgi:hypothetical protein
MTDRPVRKQEAFQTHDHYLLHALLHSLFTSHYWNELESIKHFRPIGTKRVYPVLSKRLSLSGPTSWLGLLRLGLDVSDCYIFVLAVSLLSLQSFLLPLVRLAACLHLCPPCNRPLHTLVSTTSARSIPCALPSAFPSIFQT